MLLACHKFGWILNWSFRCFQFWVTWHVGWHLAKVTGACQCTGDMNRTWGCVVRRHIGCVAHTLITSAFCHACFSSHLLFLLHPLWPQSVNPCQKWCPWKWSIQTTAPGWLNLRTTALFASFRALLLNTSSGFISSVPFRYWVSFWAAFATLPCHSPIPCSASWRWAFSQYHLGTIACSHFVSSCHYSQSGRHRIVDFVGRCVSDDQKWQKVITHTTCR